MFLYDGLGRRVREYDTDLTSGALNLAQKADYAWCGSKVCQTRDTWGTSIEMPQGLIRQGSPIAYYFHRDHLGSVVDVSQADGNHLARTMYSPYGQKELLSSDAAYVEYAGMRFHEPSGLYLTYYRAYDPKLGRWLSRDPIGEAGGLNLYGYVGCRPGSYTDPRGLYTEIIIWEPVGYGASSFGHISANVNGRNYSWGPGGWDTTYKDALAYSARQGTFRAGYGIVLNLTPEQEELLETCYAKPREKYSVFSNNCGSPHQECLKEALGESVSDSWIPPSVGVDLINSKYYKKTNYWGKETPMN